MLLHILWNLMRFILKVQHLFEIEIICNIINVTFDQCNASLLKKIKNYSTDLGTIFFVTMWYYNVILVLTMVIASLLMIFPSLLDLIWLVVISHERTELVVPVVQSAAALQVTRSIGSSAAASHRLVCVVMCRHCRGFIQKKLKYTLQDLNQIWPKHLQQNKLWFMQPHVQTSITDVKVCNNVLVFFSLDLHWTQKYGSLLLPQWFSSCASN